MNKLLFNLVFVAAITVVCCEVLPPVKQCKNLNVEDLEHRIKIDPCGLKRCKLPHNENVTVAFRFKPEKKVKDMKNDVYAGIGPVNLPFLGTTGTTACDNLRYADTDKPAQCPLEPGIEYVYKNTFFVHPIYPVVELTVHWSLNDGDRQVICFDVPAAIVKAKN